MYQYDPYGRPIPPNQYFQQYQPPQSPQVSRREYDELIGMVNKLGEKMYGEPNQNLYNQPASKSNISHPQAQISLIPVSSENEAWNYPNDLNGNRQYFIDTATMTIFSKWVDSNIDLQKAIGKLQIITGDAIDAEVVSTPSADVAEVVKGVLDEKFSELGDEITEIKALINAANAFNATKITPKKTTKTKKR